MNYRHSLLLSILLVATAVSSLVLPMSAFNGIAKIIVEPQIKTVIVSNDFSVEIWIRDLPSPMVGFEMTIRWDPSKIQLVKFVEADEYGDLRPWDTYHTEYGDHVSYAGEGGAWSADASWAKITFHCKGEGVTAIDIIESEIRASPSVGIVHEQLSGTIKQVAARPVGGAVLPTNKLEILTPYLALAGLVAVVSAAIVVKKRRA